MYLQLSPIVIGTRQTGKHRTSVYFRFAFSVYFNLSFASSTGHLHCDRMNLLWDKVILEVGPRTTGSGVFTWICPAVITNEMNNIFLDCPIDCGFLHLNLQRNCVFHHLINVGNIYICLHICSDVSNIRSVLSRHIPRWFVNPVVSEQKENTGKWFR